ncbi:DUF2993 domain-containing protein [Trichocoleus desertorum]|uniref:DUF2993 domain-containing protein n=1 Tax=Trichocoleus desertorum GB2-A4 TaxID=2933944 RepID=A0ABV0JB14_9CYAN|nr:DUF2993 domain-containing protein [Trichocoleus sp. FACHB-46]
MTSDSAKFGEQTLNKMATMAIASMIKDAEEVDVQIKTDVSKLAQGQVDSIAIKIQGLLMQSSLRLEEFYLQINRVAVKPFSAMFGKIKLMHPADGTIRVVVNEASLTQALNSASVRKKLPSLPQLTKTQAGDHSIQQVKCYLLSDGHLAFNVGLNTPDPSLPSMSFTATPEIGNDGQAIVLQNLSPVDHPGSLAEITAALVAQISDLLSLPEFKHQGMSVQIQQLEVVTGKLSWEAIASIDQFQST